MVTLRFSMVGRPHKHMFRLVAANSRSPRDGKVLEILGTYDKHGKSMDTKFKFKEDRVRYWNAKGAQPSHRVWIMLRKCGINKANTKPQLQAAKA